MFTEKSQDRFLYFPLGLDRGTPPYSYQDIYPNNKVCNESQSGADSWPPVTMSTEWWNLNI